MCTQPCWDSQILESNAARLCLELQLLAWLRLHRLPLLCQHQQAHVSKATFIWPKIQAMWFAQPQREPPLHAEGWTTLCTLVSQGEQMKTILNPACSQNPYNTILRWQSMVSMDFELKSFCSLWIQQNYMAVKIFHPWRNASLLLQAKETYEGSAVPSYISSLASPMRRRHKDNLLVDTQSTVKL